MTRLKVADIKNIANQLQRYENELIRKTGCTLLEIACFAVGVRKEEIRPHIDSLRAAVVPISSGKGVITGFSSTVKAILEHMGISAFVTGQIDVAGVMEAFERKAQLFFMADDNRFVALNFEHPSVVDNAAAAGKGFAAGLDLMSGGVRGKKVLVLGCGPVGFSAVARLLRAGAMVSVYDIVPGCSLELRRKIKKRLNTDIKIEKVLKKALSEHRLIIDATDAAGIISEELITPETFIAAPGMPSGLTQGAVKKLSGRLLHDPLQIGVATMAVEALCYD